MPKTTNFYEHLRQSLMRCKRQAESLILSAIFVAVAQADTQWWSLTPLVEPPVPVTDFRHWSRNAIDAFIGERLTENGLAPNPVADRRTLVRRVYFDLLGLPPVPEEVDEFLADQHPSAYERLVDRLLASPRYGERWARHWLDVIHYGDTHGYDKDKLREHAWPYRDYVIRSFNSDKQYSRFVREQLAGDVLFPDTVDGQVGPGFIAAGPWDFIGHAEVPETKLDGQIARHLDRDDMVTTTMNTFTSITVQCARCHDHKFDPVSQEHYYGLQAVFAALDRANRQFDHDPQVARRRRMLTQRQRQLEKDLQEVNDTIKRLAGTRLAEVDSSLAELNKRQESDLESKSSFTEQIEALKRMRHEIIEQVTSRKDRERQQWLDSELASVKSQFAALPSPSLVYCGMVHHGSGSFRGTGHTGGLPREIRILRRGDCREPGGLAHAGTIPVIENVSWKFDLPTLHSEGDRRAALSHWIIHPANPLTWRSIVNRVWQYHFGRGIVETANDFGRMGAHPTHPDLLNWLAVEFRDGGQSLKRLHRLMLTSAVYRQTPTVRPECLNVDAGNEYLWRMNRRRLEAEAIRDAVLSVSGRLDNRMFGSGFRDFVLEKPEHSPHYQYHKHDPDDPESHRRSVYRFIVRSQPQPFMDTLDCADPSQMVAKRNETLTALQALSLLNNRFMVRMSEHFARRVELDRSDIRGQVVRAFRLAMGRAPQPNEKELLVQFARKNGMSNTCRAILNSNEFVFVD